MDKWIRKLESVEITDAHDGSRIIRYTNNAGDKIEVHKGQIRILINDNVQTLDVHDIEVIDMNYMFKYEHERPYLRIKTTDKDVEFLVDTNTGQFLDLPTVYDYIRRIVAVG